MWQSLLQIVGLFESKQSKAACELLRQQYPTLQILETKIIKRELGRWIVAIFVKEEKTRVRPSSYKLFSVTDDLSGIEELPCNPTSRYWIKGRK